MIRQVSSSTSCHGCHGNSFVQNGANWRVRVREQHWVRRYAQAACVPAERVIPFHTLCPVQAAFMGAWSCTRTAATSSTLSAGLLSYGTCRAHSTSPSCTDTPTTSPASHAPPAVPTSPLDRVHTWGSRCAPHYCACVDCWTLCLPVRSAPRRLT